MIKNSELILNPDGSIFHLHLKPDQIADTIKIGRASCRERV